MFFQRLKKKTTCDCQNLDKQDSKTSQKLNESLSLDPKDHDLINSYPLFIELTKKFYLPTQEIPKDIFQSFQEYYSTLSKAENIVLMLKFESILEDFFYLNRKQILKKLIFTREGGFKIRKKDQTKLFFDSVDKINPFPFSEFFNLLPRKVIDLQNPNHTHKEVKQLYLILTVVFETVFSKYDFKEGFYNKNNFDSKTLEKFSRIQKEQKNALKKGSYIFLFFNIGLVMTFSGFMMFIEPLVSKYIKALIFTTKVFEQGQIFSLASSYWINLSLIGSFIMILSVILAIYLDQKVFLKEKETKTNLEDWKTFNLTTTTQA